MTNSAARFSTNRDSHAVAVRFALLLPLCVVALTSAPAPSRAENGSSDGGFRRLAPGVLTVIPPGVEHGDTVSRHDLVRLLADHPDLEIAKDVEFRHDVWGLEFSFKPLRMIEVDSDSDPERRLVWYLVYRVRNLGDEPVMFIPNFTLEAPGRTVAYRDQRIPSAYDPIRRREDPRRQFLTSLQVIGEIPPGEDGVWGVATWTGIDPTIDRMTLSVAGLTNAYRWDYDDAGNREYRRKKLVLNFWRPGDAIDEHENEIRFGVGEDRQPGDVDYLWVYR